MTSSNGWEEIPQDNFTVLAISEAFEIRNSMKIQEEFSNGHIVKLKTKSENQRQTDHSAIFKNIPSQEAD